jgi:hypothetical protein
LSTSWRSAAHQARYIIRNMATQKREPKILSRPANKRTPARMRAFLEAYQRTGRLTEAAKAAGVNRKTHYRKLETDPAYRKAFQEAEERAAQTLEDEAVRRGYQGVERPVMYQGKPVKLGRRILYVTTYSDMLLIALLKRFRPALYRSHVVTETTGSVDLAERLVAARRRLIEMRAAAG